jgi:superfamily II DNA/RNA helicase
VSLPVITAPETEATDAASPGPLTEQPDAGCFTDLPPALVAALAEQGITSPTPVQSAVVPDALEGRDVLGRARTGSGKTLAFGIPVLARLAGSRSRPCHPRAVVVVPTRELATQVTRSLLPVAQSVGLRLTTVYGGTPYERQTRQLRQRADVVVATPGRLDDLFEQGYVFFDDVEVTVLDEADHLCDLGFYPAVDRLVGLTPAGSQRLLLSATLDGDVDALVRTHLRDPRVHELDPNAGAIATMTHHTMVVGGFRAKQQATADLVRANGRTIVFTRTREAAVTLVGELGDLGVEAVDLHGDLSQRVRERNLHRFSSGQARAVVATDVAARGIHVDDVDLVVHFDPASDPKAYLHRSGRTARAGKDGCVITLATPKTTRAVVGLQRAAGVEVRHHDIRTAPRPLTAGALAEAGSTEAPSGAKGGSAGGYRKGGAPSGGYRKGGPSSGSRSGGPRRDGGAGHGSRAHGRQHGDQGGRGSYGPR